MTSLEAKMAELTARFAAGLPEELRALKAELAAGDRGAVRARAHNLAGRAGMFGHADIGEAAFALEGAAECGQDIATPAARLERLLGEACG